MLQPMGVQAVAQGIGKFNRDIDSMNKSVTKTNKSLARTEKDITPAINAFGALSTAMGVATGAALAIDKAFDFGRMGAAAEQTASSFDFLINKLGITETLLRDLQVASNGTISDTQLMSATLTLAAGSSDQLASAMINASPQLLEYAKAANKLNPALGDTAFLYDSITRGIKRNSPLILDNLGIVVKVGEANEKYADQIGKTVDQLTAEERSMALLNATLEAGDNLLQQVGGSTESATDSFDRLDASLTNVKESLLKKFAPGLAQAADHLNLLLNWNELLVTSLVEHEKNLRTTAETYDDYVTELRRAHDTAGATSWKVDVLSESQWANMRAMQGASSQIAYYASLMGDIGPATEDASAAISLWKPAVEGLDRAYQSLNTNIGGTVTAVQNQVAFLAAGGGELIGLAEQVGGAFQAGLIDEEQTQEMLNQIGIAGLAIEEEIGNITPWEAQQTAVEEYGSEWDTVKADIAEARTKIEELPRDIKTQISVEVRWYLKESGSIPGMQHGGQFTVGGRPGVDQNLVAFRATRGEVVTVTPAGAVDNSRHLTMGDTNIHGGIDAKTFDQAMRSWLGS